MTFLKSTIFRYLVICFVAWGVLFFASIESAVAIWIRSETFAHCFIILPICIYLIRLKWPQLNNAQLKPSLLPLIFLLPTLAIWLFGSMAQVLVIEQAATFALLPLIIWIVMGNQVARILLFVFLFWMFSVPVGEFLVPQLQELTADITVWSLQMTGIPVYREGLYIAIPGGLFEVAVACSGIRYLIASFTLGTLFAYLNFNGFKKRLIFILFSIVLPLLANGIRAYGIVIIAHLSDMKYATGVDHLVYGWLFFGVVIFIMFTIGGRWADPAPKAVAQINPNGPAMQTSQLVKPLVILTLLLGSAFAYKLAFENQVSEYKPDIRPIFRNSTALQDSSWLPTYKGAAEEITGHHDGVDYFFAYYNANVQGSELISGGNHLFNIERWSIVESQSHENYRTMEITDNFGRKRLISYAYVVPWHMSHKALEIKLVQAIEALLGQAQIGYVLMISMPVDDQSDRQTFMQRSANLFTPQLRELVGG